MGIEISHITTAGNEIGTSAPYEQENNSNRKFKIFSSNLINLGYFGYKSLAGNSKVTPTNQVFFLSTI